MIPQFYCPKKGVTVHQAHKDSPLEEFKGQRVFAPSGDHLTPGWITLGEVSFTTPFGEGTYGGFKKSEVRRATKAEILNAITTYHSHGIDFCPHELHHLSKTAMLKYQLKCARERFQIREHFGAPLFDEHPEIVLLRKIEAKLEKEGRL